MNNQKHMENITKELEKLNFSKDSKVNVHEENNTKDLKKEDNHDDKKNVSNDKIKKDEFKDSHEDIINLLTGDTDNDFDDNDLDNLCVGLDDEFDELDNFCVDLEDYDELDNLYVDLNVCEELDYLNFGFDNEFDDADEPFYDFF
ncbi:uncharacterized protein LOC122508640 [Leptopilina heterotoma]|uniref:uncharacterized protein LOC122508640 n=1 Tax=Leptopilina heterotoma TaxID=63436 RepID=UPI001CA86938|nr:uncharacterized protein LOC122508640 [Leptopilina heterotoma]